MQPRVLMCEELTRTALRGYQEHALDARHFAIEGQAGLPHDVERLPARSSHRPSPI